MVDQICDRSHACVRFAGPDTSNTSRPFLTVTSPSISYLGTMRIDDGKGRIDANGRKLMQFATNGDVQNAISQFHLECSIVRCTFIGIDCCEMGFSKTESSVRRSNFATSQSSSQSQCNRLKISNIFRFDHARIIWRCSTNGCYQMWSIGCHVMDRNR
jgi:hypothetical protein